MRKWLFYGAVLAAVYALMRLNTKRNRERHPRLKRLDEAINITVFVLLAAYTIVFLVWLFKQIFR